MLCEECFFFRCEYSELLLHDNCPTENNRYICQTILTYMTRLFFIILLSLSLAACHNKTSGTRGDDSSAVATARPQTPIDTVKQVVMRAQQQNKLYTTECKVHKVVLFSDNGKIGGRLLDIDKPGYRKVAVPLDVTLKGYVDFSTFDSTNVQRTDSMIIITLPDPQIVITASHIDFKAARQYVSTFRSNFNDEEITQLAKQGEDSIKQHIGQYGLVEASRNAAARVLIPMLKQLGYPESNIVVRFRKDYDNKDLIRRVRTLNTPAS